MVSVVAHILFLWRTDVQTYGRTPCVKIMTTDSAGACWVIMKATKSKRCEFLLLQNSKKRKKRKNSPPPATKNRPFTFKTSKTHESRYISRIYVLCTNNQSRINAQVFSFVLFGSSAAAGGTGNWPCCWPFPVNFAGSMFFISPKGPQALCRAALPTVYRQEHTHFMLYSCMPSSS